MSFSCKHLRRAHFGKTNFSRRTKSGRRFAPESCAWPGLARRGLPLRMSPRNLASVHRSARVSVPSVEEGRHLYSYWTQRTKVSTDVDVGVCGSRPAYQEARAADFALLAFERGRRFYQDRPTSFRLAPPRLLSLATSRRHLIRVPCGFENDCVTFVAVAVTRSFPRIRTVILESGRTDSRPDSDTRLQ